MPRDVVRPAPSRDCGRGWVVPGIFRSLMTGMTERARVFEVSNSDVEEVRRELGL